MSKKDQVKEVIDTLIKEGRDFADLTQGELVNLPELEGISKTTIKRAKKEYKLEKVVVKGDYKEQAIKRRIYKYLDRHPKSSLSDLREALPNILPAKVSEYHQIWLKKRQKTKITDKKKKKSVTPRKLREMVFSVLDNTPDATIDHLIATFPGANKSSLNSYLGHWKKKQRETETVKEGGLYQTIINFLDNDPKASIETLKRTFSDVPEKSLKIYHNLWQKRAKSEPPPEDPLQKVVQEFISDTDTRQEPMKSGGSEITKATTANGSSKDAGSTEAFANQDSRGSSHTKQELIATLKKTVEAQKNTIDELNAEYTLLKNRQSDILIDLQHMDSKEIEEVKEFVSTYLAGLKGKP